jgi:hypothetical protein
VLYSVPTSLDSSAWILYSYADCIAWTLSAYFSFSCPSLTISLKRTLFFSLTLAELA